MAATTTELIVRLSADAKGFAAELGSAGKTVESLNNKAKILGTSMAEAGKRMTLGFTVPFVAGMGFAVKAASDLNEAQSKSNVIFGQSSGVINRWASGAARDFGLSQRAALDNAASFGNMFSQLGIGGPQVTSMSKKMVELAADFASFHNADITEVLLAQQAAFRGEYDAVQRFVPTINAAAVETKALAMTGKENAAQLTAQDKAMAAYTLMVEGAGDALGDFDRTADGAANQMRTAQAQLEDAAASIGSVVLPMFADLAGVVADVAEWFAGLPEPVKQAAVAFGALIAAAGPLLWVSGSIIKNVQVLTSAFPALGAAIGPALIVVALTAAFMGLAYALGFFDEIGTGVTVTVDEMTNHKKRLKAALGELNGTLREYNGTMAQFKGWTDEAKQSSSAYTQAVILSEGKTAALVEQTKKLAEASPTLAREFLAKAEAAGMSEKVLRRLRDVVSDTEAATVKAAVAADQDAANLARLKAEATGTAQSFDELRAAFEQMTNAQFDVEGATIRMDKAIQDLVVSSQAGKDGTLEGRQAFLDAKQSVDDYGTSVYDAYIAAGASAEDAKNMQVAALSEVAGRLDPGSPLRVWLDEYIGGLNSIPRFIDTFLTITTNADDTARAVIGAAGEWIIGRRASGGPVAAGAPYLVGEEGPELFVPGTSGTIVPNGAGGAGGTMSAGGGGGQMVAYLVLDGKVAAEAVFAAASRAGGPKLSGNAIAN